MNQSANHPSNHKYNIHFHLFPQLNPAELTKTFSRLTELTLSCTKIPEAILLLESLAKNSSLTRWHNLTERWWMSTKSRQHWLGVSLSCLPQAHNQLLSQLQLRLRPVRWLLLHTNRIAGKKNTSSFSIISKYSAGESIFQPEPVAPDQSRAQHLAAGSPLRGNR